MSLEAATATSFLIKNMRAIGSVLDFYIIISLDKLVDFSMESPKKPIKSVAMKKGWGQNLQEYGNIDQI